MYVYSNVYIWKHVYASMYNLYAYMETRRHIDTRTHNLYMRTYIYICTDINYLRYMLDCSCAEGCARSHGRHSLCIPKSILGLGSIYGASGLVSCWACILSH